MALPEIVGESCNENILSCLEISETSCKADMEELILGDCSNDIPATVDDPGEVVGFAKKLTNCAVKGLLAKHNDQFKKNVDTSVCEAVGE